jgi:hypothetical protein
VSYSTWSVQLLTSRRDTIPPTGSTLRRHLIHLSPSAIAHPSVPNHIASPPARISVQGSKMTSRIPNPSSTNAPRLSTAPSSIKPRQLVCLPPLFPLPWLFFLTLSPASFSTSRHSSGHCSGGRPFCPNPQPPLSIPLPPSPNHFTISKHPATQEKQLTNAMQSHLHAQLAQLSANLADLENLLRMTSVQAESVRGLGAWHGGLYISPSFLTSPEKRTASTAVASGASLRKRGNGKGKRTKANVGGK